MKNLRYELKPFKCPPLRSPRVLCRNHSETKAINHLLHSYFITGFADGESCFMINVSKNSTRNTGYRVKATFQIKIHTRDLALLEEIQYFFNGIGYIYNYPDRDFLMYIVTSITDLERIIIHFDKYPLITQK